MAKGLPQSVARPGRFAVGLIGLGAWSVPAA
jgi:hypothetical protein